MSHLRLDPDDAELDDVCPGCGYLVLGGHPPSCPFYDLLDAITLEFESEETYRMMLDYRPSPEEFKDMLLRFILDGMPDPPPESDDDG